MLITSATGIRAATASRAGATAVGPPPEGELARPSSRATAADTDTAATTAAVATAAIRRRRRLLACGRRR